MESLDKKASLAGGCRMLIGIISDTHDRLARTRVAVELLRTAGAEAIVHCGDFTGPDILSACSALPLYFVFGNNDSHRATSLQGGGGRSWRSLPGMGGRGGIGRQASGVTHGHTFLRLPSSVGGTVPITCCPAIRTLRTISTKAQVHRIKSRGAAPGPSLFGSFAGG